MEHFIIEGGSPLRGTIDVQGAKNSALPILAATVLALGTHHLHRVPNLKDIRAMCQILESLGATYSIYDGTILIDTTNIEQGIIPDSLMSQIRSSIFLMGPLVARLGTVSVTRPGGCDIGQRPIDIHLQGLAQLGVQIEEIDGMIHCTAEHLKGADISLPFPSVGATENIMMAAVYAQGETIIRNAACEPEVEDLANFLNQMGAKIEGAGTSEIHILGVERYLTGTEYQILSDRIVAGTWLIAAVMTKGDIVLRNVRPQHLSSLIQLMEQLGVDMEYGNDYCHIRGGTSLYAPGIQVMTDPYPGFPTDLQPQLLALLSITEGHSQITENIFESRFKHVSELQKMGANLSIEQNRKVNIRGVSQLQSAQVKASDLRAGAALVLAGLVADGISIIEGLDQIDRGYEQMDQVLSSVGARIHREQNMNAYTRQSDGK